MWKKKTKTKFKTKFKKILISNEARFILDSFNDLEEALEEWWKIYNSWVNTVCTGQFNGYNLCNVTWFILSKEVEEDVKEGKEEVEEWEDNKRIDWYYYR